MDSFENNASSSFGDRQNQPPSTDQEPRHQCLRGCGLFGTRENQWLCSKCYSDELIKHKISVHIKRKIDQQSNSNPQKFKKQKMFRELEKPLVKKPETDHQTEKSIFNNKDDFKVDSGEHMESLKNNSTAPVVVAKKNRCLCCKKKIGLLGFTCRCGGTFCATHRYSESHTCSFDFKTTGKLKIEKENPRVEADKLVDRA